MANIRKLGKISTIKSVLPCSPVESNPRFVYLKPALYFPPPLTLLQVHSTWSNCYWTSTFSTRSSVSCARIPWRNSCWTWSTPKPQSCRTPPSSTLWVRYQNSEILTSAALIVSFLSVYRTGFSEYPQLVPRAIRPKFDSTIFYKRAAGLQRSVMPKTITIVKRKCNSSNKIWLLLLLQNPDSTIMEKAALESSSRSRGI